MVPASVATFPVTARLAPKVMVAVLLKSTLPPIVVTTMPEVDADPPTVKSPSTVVILVMVLAPLPDKVKLE